MTETINITYNFCGEELHGMVRVEKGSWSLSDSDEFFARLYGLMDLFGVELLDVRISENE
jgi:hypothetical protein